MLLNHALNNTADHARNFSFTHRGDGYRLAPAYDLVSRRAAGSHAASIISSNALRSMTLLFTNVDWIIRSET